MLNKLRSNPTELEMNEVRNRVRRMRDRVGHSDVRLADLFAMLGEDERPVLRATSEHREAAVVRLRPDQIPDRMPAPNP